jgi:cytochrome c oxidase subunit 1
LPTPASTACCGHYYVVAHFHYVLSLGAVFAIFAGWYYWFPKSSGYMYSETIGKLHFWFTFIGVTWCSSPSTSQSFRHAACVDYPDAFAGWDRGVPVGSYISGFGVLIFIWAWSMRLRARNRQPIIRGVRAPPRWNGRCRRRTVHQFEVLPRVQ